MPTVFLCPVYCGRVLLDGSNNVAVNGNVWTYFAGTTTLANTYVDYTGVKLNPNPLTIANNGRLPNQIWIPQGQNTKLVFMDANNVIIDVQDNVLGVSDPSIAQLEAYYAFAQANLASSQANIANLYVSISTGTSANAYKEANAAANTVAVYAYGTEVLSNANLDFINTSSVTVAASYASGNTSLAFTGDAGIDNESQSTANGYANLASNVCIQWGSFPVATYDTVVDVSFPVPFLSACYGVQLIMSATINQNYVPRQSANGFSKSGFTCYMEVFTATDPNFTPPAYVYWTAIGDI